MRGMIWDEWPHIRYFGSFIILLELREGSFNMTRGGGAMKILRGGSENFRHPKGGL